MQKISFQKTARCMRQNDKRENNAWACKADTHRAAPAAENTSCLIYPAKRVILEIYEAMQRSIRTGQPYQIRLDPPPANPRCCHPPGEEVRA